MKRLCPVALGWNWGRHLCGSRPIFRYAQTGPVDPAFWNSAYIQPSFPTYSSPPSLPNFAGEI
ncbi:hypothetical protein OUZ56_007417 [Daphnia magna]|uniref:Uncharacterized protein n=1 Tax=Daphnia magna TaxID=35525 RepID=A0ABR0AA32_9CRUS|nr:hypothetical protein OUZ56_007417 [Daphnia magna]